MCARVLCMDMTDHKQVDTGRRILPLQTPM